MNLYIRSTHVHMQSAKFVHTHASFFILFFYFMSLFFYFFIFFIFFIFLFLQILGLLLCNLVMRSAAALIGYRFACSHVSCQLP